MDGACEAAVRVLISARWPRVEAEDVVERGGAAAATWSGATTEVDGEKEAESGGGAAWRRGRAAARGSSWATPPRTEREEAGGGQRGARGYHGCCLPRRETETRDARPLARWEVVGRFG